MGGRGPGPLRHAREALTGRKPLNFAIAKVTVIQLRYALAKGREVPVGTLDKGVSSPLIENHVYAVSAMSVSGVVTLRDPWEVDGRCRAADGMNYGVLTVDWKTFQKNMDDVVIG